KHEAEEAARLGKERQTAEEGSRLAERNHEAAEVECQLQRPRQSDVELMPLAGAEQANGKQSAILKRSINLKKLLYTGVATTLIFASLFVIYRWFFFTERLPGLYTVITYP